MNKDYPVIEMKPLDDSIRIAVATEQILGVRKELAEHTADDREFQEKLFEYLEKTLGNISTKVDTLWDDMNTRKGSKSAFSKVGSIANAAITLLISAGTALIMLRYGK